MVRPVPRSTPPAFGTKPVPVPSHTPSTHPPEDVAPRVRVLCAMADRRRIAEVPSDRVPSKSACFNRTSSCEKSKVSKREELFVAVLSIGNSYPCGITTSLCTRSYILGAPGIATNGAKDATRNKDCAQLIVQLCPKGSFDGSARVPSPVLRPPQPPKVVNAAMTVHLVQAPQSLSNRPWGACAFGAYSFVFPLFISPPLPLLGSNLYFRVARKSAGGP